jgi:lipoprotein-anchoring transpeptidase ErfK/SrfK
MNQPFLAALVKIRAAIFTKPTLVADLLWRMRGRFVCGGSGVVPVRPSMSMQMQRIAFPTLVTTLLAFGPAFAGPLNLNPQTRPSQTAIGQVFAAQPAEPAPVRQAAADPLSLGGGFLEMLFRGPGGAAPQPQYQQEQSAPPIINARRPQAGDEVDGIDPASAQAAQINPRFLRQEVNYDGRESAGTVVINTRERMLYLVQGNGRAIRYGIGVGRPGFTWAGAHTISNMRQWPDWRPPAEMIRRQPHLPRYMRGGPDNPLGARAMYLGSTLYRIHGSNEPWTIGTQVSSGCIRMRNEDVIDLYGRVRVGTRVVVI